MLLNFGVGTDSGEQKSEEIPLNVLDRPTGTHFMEGHMHDQDNTGETYYFILTTILAATNNFSDSNKLGEGGFGPVYKVKETYVFHIEEKWYVMEVGFTWQINMTFDF